MRISLTILVLVASALFVLNCKQQDTTVKKATMHFLQSKFSANDGAYKDVVKKSIRRVSQFRNNVQDHIRSHIDGCVQGLSLVINFNSNIFSNKAPKKILHLLFPKHNFW